MGASSYEALEGQAWLLLSQCSWQAVLSNCSRLVHLLTAGLRSVMLQSTASCCQFELEQVQCWELHDTLCVVCMRQQQPAPESSQV